MKKLMYILVLPLVLALGYGATMVRDTAIVLSGFGAKTMCSLTFISNRDPESIHRDELSYWLYRLGTYSVDHDDKSASGNVFGFAHRKAIYREGLGCTVYTDITEDQLRGQTIQTYAQSAFNIANLPWPAGDNDAVHHHHELDKEKLQAAVDDAFVETSTDPTQLNKTRAVVVLHNGKIIAEKYADGFDRDTRHISWSMSKSFMATLIGILVKQGKLDVHAPAPIAKWQNDNRRHITLNHLMQMNSGLEWNEDYSKSSLATYMIFNSDRTDEFAASTKLRYEPGTVHEYSSGTSNIISGIARSVLGDEAYHRFPYEELFNKIGMHSFIFEPDASGTYMASSNAFATARDYARFGQFLLQDGVWNGERILPEGWVQYMTTPGESSDGYFAAHMWINLGANGDASTGKFPSCPIESFLSCGKSGQYIFVVPSHNLVVVRLGNGHDMFYEGIDKLVAQVIESLPSES